MDPVYEVSVPTFGEIPVFCKITTADVRCSYEDIFCREAWRITGEDLYCIRYANVLLRRAEREMESSIMKNMQDMILMAVITTRELIRMIRSAHISPQTLVDVESDRPMA